MAGERKQYQRAQACWERLHELEAYSVPDTLGTLAVMFSGFDFHKNGSDIDAFEAEAVEIARRVAAVGKKSEVIRITTGENINEVLGCRDYSSMVTIGHGALSYLYVEHGLWKGKQGNRYDWRDVSKAATHLKTGVFIQRQCGNASRLFSPPMGALAMTDHAMVFAAVNNNFDPASLDDEENKLVVAVTESQCMTYDEIKTRFSYDDFLAGAAVAQEDLDNV